MRAKYARQIRKGILAARADVNCLTVAGIRMATDLEARAYYREWDAAWLRRENAGWYGKHHRQEFEGRWED